MYELCRVSSESVQIDLLMKSVSVLEKRDLQALSYTLLNESDWMNRSMLLDLIYSEIPSCIIPPKNRLVNLINQALEYQKSHCVFHKDDPDELFTLFGDHYCVKEQLPCTETTRLEGHRDEVWFVAVSNNGQWIASASKDKSVCVWSLHNGVVAPVIVLVGHLDAVTCVAWSPNDLYLATASNDKTAMLWKPSLDVCVHTFTRHTDSVCAVAWLDNVRFVTGSCDKSVILYTVNGDQLASWRFQGRVQDLCVIYNFLIVASSERNIQIIDLTGEDMWYNEPAVLGERFPVTSITPSKLSRQILVNVSRIPPCIHLWDLETKKLQQQYVGHAQGRFIVRSSFAGNNEKFVICGSEYGKVFILSKI